MISKMKGIDLFALITLGIWLLAVNPAIGQPNILQQKVSFTANEKTIAEVLEKITELSQLKFSYSKEELLADRINLQVDNKPISFVLDNLFANTGLEYRLFSDMVAIRKMNLPPRTAHLSLSGNVVDAENNMPLAFASVGVLKKAQGTISNASGSFELRLPLSFQSDSLIISMMGYAPVKLAIAGMAENMMIKMKPQPVMLNEVEVTDKRITVADIFKEIRSRIKLNYPVEDYAMECFYREIKKQNDTYRSLLEAALVIRDNGYDQPKSRESTYVREVRGSSNFVNRFSSFWQENNLLRETLGLNAVRHPSSTPDVFGKNVYQLKGTTLLNDKQVYVLISDPIENDCWQRTLYVDVDTYAIYRSEEVITNFALSWKVEDSDSLHMRLTKGTSSFDFRTYNGRLYLNHIRHEVENEYFDPVTGKILERFTIVNDLLVNNIVEDSQTETGGLKKVENRALELQLTPYNDAFWEQYNAIRQTPLESEIMKDLLRNGALDDQFVKSAEKTMTKKKARDK
jgi:hypothetical protein